jgi:hypothetical protein
MPNLIEKIFGSTAKEVEESLGEVVDKISTTDDEKLAAKKDLTNVVMTALNRSMELTQNVMLAEMQGNWLQRSWRPIIMLSFGFVILYRYFLAPVFHLQAIDMPEMFWDLLNLGMGGYVIGRSVEKVAETVTKNVDISFIKKKNREQ